MKVIHVLRKPKSEGSVAQNVLKHGTGALNIDASRIGTGEDRTAGGMAGSQPSLYEDGFHQERRERPVGGRWPANLILQHLDGCRCEGVANWICVEGCAVLDLDEQSGVLKSGAMDSIAKGDQYNTYGKMYERRVANPASEGGASRFFKQVRADEGD